MCVKPELSALVPELDTGDQALPAPERFAVLNSLGSRQETGPLLWTFVQQNYDALVNRLPELQSVPVGTRVISTLGRLCTTQARQEVQSFFAERSATLSGGPRALAQTLERIDLCVARRASQAAALKKYLSEQF